MNKPCNLVALHHQMTGSYVVDASPLVQQPLDKWAVRLILSQKEQIEQLETECAQLRAAIRRLCNIYVVDDYYDGQLREERLEAAVNRAIDAALAKQGEE